MPKKDPNKTSPGKLTRKVKKSSIKEKLQHAVKFLKGKKATDDCDVVVNVAYGENDNTTIVCEQVLSPGKITSRTVISLSSRGGDSPDVDVRDLIGSSGGFWGGGSSFSLPSPGSSVSKGKSVSQVFSGNDFESQVVGNVECIEVD